MNDNNTTLPEKENYRSIFLLWAPLAGMWLVMGVEQPLISAIIARLPDAKVNLAAFGVTFALALIVEGPVVQLLSAGTALSDNRENYSKMLTLTHILAASMTVIHLILALTPLYRGLLGGILEVPDQVIPFSRWSFIAMVPWAAVIAYRRLWQGVLIRYGKTREISVTMAARLASMAAVLFIGLKTEFVSGALLGGLALSVGVIVGMVLTWIFVRPILREKVHPAGEENEIMGWPRVLKFYYPLALTSTITFFINPVITAGLGHAPLPLESLAAWPVINSFLALFQTVGFSFQEVIVARFRSRHQYRLLKNSSRMLAAGLFALFLIFAVTPLNRIWYTGVSHLPKDLLELTKLPTILLIPFPAFLCFVSWFRGVFVTMKDTAYITQAVIIRSGVLALVILLSVSLFSWAGVYNAAAGMTISMAAEALYLYIRSRRKVVDYLETIG